MKCYEQQIKVRVLLPLAAAKTLQEVLEFIILGRYFDDEYDKDLEIIATNVSKAIKKQYNATILSKHKGLLDKIRKMGYDVDKIRKMGYDVK